MVNASDHKTSQTALERCLCTCESRLGVGNLLPGTRSFAYDNPSFIETELTVDISSPNAPIKEVSMPGSCKMPSGIGGSYTSLADDVYKSTTAPEEKFSVMESVKKAFNLIGNPTTRTQGPYIVTEEDRSDKKPKALLRNKSNMPASAVPEETALLGTMPSDSMDDIELKNIQLQFPVTRTLSKEDPNIQEVTVETDRGTLLVAVQGNRSKPAILTYHDLGLNYVSGFQAFFNYIDMRTLIENFCVYHVNAPGHEPNATTLPEDYLYPTMDELAEQLLFVLGYFGLHKVIGFGVGAGANILARFSLHHPEKVEALCLINCVSTTAGWIEWGYQKLNTRYLRYKGMTQGVLDYLMWHHFGRGTEERNHDLIQVYKEYFEHHVNPVNLALFIDSYIRRTDLNITRESTESGKRKDMSPTLSMAVMNITGSLSPHVDDTVTLNGRLNPTNSSWMKISDCGMVLEEQPGKVSEAFRLFLQGQGYALKLARSLSTSTSAEAIYPSRGDAKELTMVREGSVDVLDSRCKAQKSGKRVIHITENPIPDTIAC